ncbi:MAG: hypothetical protein E7350_00790 [Clostridiales bacterium]|nr:hypothetical protein [Clostridiales bacterium]
MVYDKVYVAVVMMVDEDGREIPLFVIYEDRRYDIDKVLAITKAPPKHVAGLVTTRYDCKIAGKAATVYREDGGRWFVEVAR